MTTLVSIVRVEFVLFRTKFYVVIFDLFSYVIWIFIYIAVHSHNLFLFNAQQSSMYYCYTLHTHTQTYTHIHRYTHTNSHTHIHTFGLVWFELSDITSEMPCMFVYRYFLDIFSLFLYKHLKGNILNEKVNICSSPSCTAQTISKGFVTFYKYPTCHV